MPIDSEGRDTARTEAAPVSGTSEALQCFLRAAYPCCTSIDPRGYQWSEAYLDQARAAALAAEAPQEAAHLADGISLSSYSGGASPEGLYGRVTLRINGSLVDYVRSARESQEATQGQALPEPLIGYVCERTALVRMRDDVESLPLHPHKRKVVREWLDAAVSDVEAKGRDAALAQLAQPAQAETKGRP